MPFTLPNTEKNDFASGQILSFAHLNDYANNVIALANYIGSANMMSANLTSTYSLPTTAGYNNLAGWTLSKSVGASGVFSLVSLGIQVLAAGTYMVFANATYSVPSGSISNIAMSVSGGFFAPPSNKVEASSNSGLGYLSAFIVDDVAANITFNVLVNNLGLGSGRLITQCALTIIRLK